MVNALETAHSGSIYVFTSLVHLLININFHDTSQEVYVTGTTPVFNAYTLYSVFMANFVITERHIFLGNMIHGKALI